MNSLYFCPFAKRTIRISDIYLTLSEAVKMNAAQSLQCRACTPFLLTQVFIFGDVFSCNQTLVLTNAQSVKLNAQKNFLKGAKKRDLIIAYLSKYS